MLELQIVAVVVVVDLKLNPVPAGVMVVLV
jgi:hypothetical protein